MTRVHARGLGLLLLLSLAAFAGCNSTPGTVPVEGVLTWEDGKPISGASIRFVPNSGGREATGYTGKDGEFTLNTFSQGDGAIPGDYAVVVTKTAGTTATSTMPQAGSAKPEEMAKLMKGFHDKAKAAPPTVVNPVPPIYGDAKTTPLKWRVETGGKKVELKLKHS